MAPIFAGSLPSKKKADLQSLALALDISTEGTKEELQTRIKKYLDENQSELEGDPQFSGLFDKRRKKKESVPPPSKRSTVVNANERSNVRRAVHLGPIYESTPAKDLSDVSAFLKNPPLSPTESDEPSSPNRRRSTRSSLAIAGFPNGRTPLPPSLETSTIVDQSLLNRSSIVHIPAPQVSSLLRVVKRKQKAVVQSTNEALYNARAFFSNTRTIWSISVLAQFLYIYVSVVPWKFLHIPFPPAPSDIPPPTVIAQPALSQSWNLISFTIPYPPPGTFESRMFWTIIMHWFIPAVLIPLVAGILISFKPISSTSASPPLRVILSESREISRVTREEGKEDEEEETSQLQFAKPQLSAPFDSLTASIIQLAAQVAYTFPAVHGPFPLSSGINPLIKSVDILGFKWRVLSASICVAFSFAEALGNAGSLKSSQSPILLKSLGQSGTTDTIEESEVD